jgi:hypothetical protein
MSLRFGPALRVLVVLVVLVAPVLAQNPGAAPPSVESAVLYAHGKDDGTQDELSGWMNTLPDDGNDVALGASVTAAGVAALPVQPVDRTYTITLTPALAASLQLDGEGTIDVTAHIGSSSGQSILVMVATQITSGDTVVAEGEEVEHSYAASGDGEYPAVTWSLTPAVTELAAGEPLVWTVTTSGFAQALFLSVSAERGRSSIALPIIGGAGPPAPTTVYQPVTTELFSVAVQDAEPVTQTRVHNWTTGSTQLEVELNVTATNGSIEIEALDGDDATAFSRSFAAHGDETFELEDAAPGNWTVTLHLTDFSGAYTVRIEDAAPSPTSTTTTSTQPTSSTTATTATTATSSTQAEEDSGIPAVGLVAVVCVLAAVVVARRKT